MKRNEVEEAQARAAEMLEGAPEKVSEKLCGILAGHGLF